MESIESIKTTLVLDELEVGWLKNIMQNPIFVENPDEEGSTDKDMRHKFWTALGGK